MKYLCLCYYDTGAFAGLTANAQQATGEACQPHDTALKATGQLFAQGSMSLPESWVYFVLKDGKPVLSKGPYLSGNRQARAFLLIEAAQRVASRHAAANFGEHLGFAVEVRACEMFETFG